MFLARSASFFETSCSASAPHGHAGQRDRVHGVAVERAVLQRVGRVADLGQVALGELVGVDDDVGAARQVGQVGLERGRVHRDQHVRRVARREDVVVGEVHLEAGDAGQRAGGGADLGREVRQRRDVVAELGGLRGEPVAGELHAVAGVAGEPDDHPVQLTDLLGGDATGHRSVRGTVLSPPAVRRRRRSTAGDLALLGHGPDLLARPAVRGASHAVTRRLCLGTPLPDRLRRCGRPAPSYTRKPTSAAPCRRVKGATCRTGLNRTHPGHNYAHMIEPRDKRSGASRRSLHRTGCRSTGRATARRRPRRRSRFSCPAGVTPSRRAARCHRR